MEFSLEKGASVFFILIPNDLCYNDSTFYYWMFYHQ